jgi:hypothetical protein
VAPQISCLAHVRGRPPTLTLPREGGGCN